MLDLSACDLLLVRHGEPDGVAPRSFLGHGAGDPGLGTEGRAQLAEVGRQLAAYCPCVAATPSCCWCSDLARAVESAGILASRAGLTVRPDPRLREQDFGGWDGLAFDAVEERWPDASRTWLADPLDEAPAGGETVRAVDARVGAWLDGLRVAEPDGTVLVVAHFTPLAVLAARVLELPLDRALRLHLRRGHWGHLAGGRIQVWGLPAPGCDRA